MISDCDPEAKTGVQVPTIKAVEKGKKKIIQEQSQPIQLGREGMIKHHNETRAGDSGTPLLV